MILEMYKVNLKLLEVSEARPRVGNAWGWGDLKGNS